MMISPYESNQSRLRRDCVLMCEPGRGLVASGCTLLAQIQLRKDNKLYINDGIYQSLSETLLGKMKLPTRLINPARSSSPNRARIPPARCTTSIW